MLHLLRPEPEPPDLPEVHVQVGEGTLLASREAFAPARDAVLAHDGDVHAGVIRVELAGAQTAARDVEGAWCLSVDIDVVGTADQNFWCLASTAQRHGAALTVDTTEVDLVQHLNAGAAPGEGVGDQIVSVAVAYWARARLSELWTYDWPGDLEGQYLGRQVVRRLRAHPLPEPFMRRLFSGRVSRMAAIGLAGAAAAFAVGCGYDDQARVCVNQQQKVVEEERCEFEERSGGTFIAPFFWHYGGRVGSGDVVRGGQSVRASDIAANRAASSRFSGTTVRGSGSTVA
ncbi:MAG: hypothetical protein M3N52_03195 [Actinomycetota bacterium]|nr:hypothetical protein [Actinomycetota bacterium]